MRTKHQPEQHRRAKQSPAGSHRPAPTGGDQTSLEELRSRELIANCSNESQLRRALASGPKVLYCGFDPTAESLHIGNLLQLITLRRFQQAGHIPIVLIGGATGLVGDPSGKRQERSLEGTDTVAHRADGIRNQIESLLDPAAHTIVVNNMDWLGELDTISFLRDTGKHFSISAMLAKDSVRSRLATGLSYTEFSYSLLQALDFLELRRRHGCILQIGGSDQWGNITAGIDFVRRVDDATVFGLTLPLLTNTDGTKLGKTEHGTIWLDANLTPPFVLYQWLLNTSDAEVTRLLHALTFLPLAAITDLQGELATHPERRLPQRTLAQKVTRIVHGESGVAQAERITDALFGGALGELEEPELAQLAAGMPTVSASHETLRTWTLADLVVAAGLAPSKATARHLCAAGAIHIFDERILDPLATDLDARLRCGRFLIVRRGIKQHGVVVAGRPCDA